MSETPFDIDATRARLSYRGYQILTHPFIPSRIWIETHGFFIGSAASVAEAKAVIDRLVDPEETRP